MSDTPLDIEDILADLFPLNRSLTGPGNRSTLEYLQKIVPEIKIRSVKSGTKIFDWVVPEEWAVNDAYVKNKHGKKIIDFQKNNLHLMGYSTAFSGKLNKKELLQHVYTLPRKPDWIPYRTTYYSKQWGFCCNHSLLNSPDFVGPFEVLVDTRHIQSGQLIFGEAYKKGLRDEEILISTYMCHPSLANDNLSGLVGAALLFRDLAKRKTNFSYRLVIVPETIGALAFLKSHKNHKKILGGTILTTIAGPDPISMKEAHKSEHWINRVTHCVLSERFGDDYITYPFKPNGSDERQYSSPAFDIAMPSIHKSKYYEYEEYHTSQDNLNFISSQALAETVDVYTSWISAVDSFCFPSRKNAEGEYFLSGRGLYPSVGGTINQPSHYTDAALDTNSGQTGIKITQQHLDAFGWVMHMSNGKNSNIDIAERSGLSLTIINQVLTIFSESGLVDL